MNAISLEQRKAWMAQWRSAAIALARVQHAEVLSIDMTRVAEELEDAFQFAIRTVPPPPTSGLVEQQRLFGRYRPK